MLNPVVLEELSGVELSGVDVGNNVVVMGVVLSCLFLCLCLCACSVKSKKSKKKRIEQLFHLTANRICKLIEDKICYIKK